MNESGNRRLRPEETERVAGGGDGYRFVFRTNDIIFQDGDLPHHREYIVVSDAAGNDAGMKVRVIDHDLDITIEEKETEVYASKLTQLFRLYGGKMKGV